MARFEFGGIGELEISLADVANMSADEKKKILLEGADVIEKKLAEVLERFGLCDTRQLISGITHKEQIRGGEPVLLVSSYGKRKKGYTGKRIRKGRSRGHYSGTNDELLYLHEYGTPRMKASHPVEISDNESADEMTAAMAAAWDEYLKSKNL